MDIRIKTPDHEKLMLTLFGILILFFILLHFINQRAPQITNWPAADRTEIIVFGDSLAEGFGTDDGGFVSRLEILLGHKITNLGVSGDTTRDGLIRLNNVLARDAKLVIISLGGNDFIQRVPEQDVRHNFNKMISQIQNDGSMVILLDAPGYRGMLKELSKTHKTGYVSNILSGLIGKDEYMFDAIHPNAAGYQKIAEKIEPEVRDLYRQK